MSHLTLNNLRQWVKNDPGPLACFLFKTAKGVRTFSLPAPRIVFRPILYVYTLLTNAVQSLVRTMFWTPLFKVQLSHVGERLYLYGGLPYMSGPLKLSVGNDCRISGKTTFSARTSGSFQPEMIVKDNVDIGWMTTIAVGRLVEIGNNVRMAGQCFIAGYPGHPIDPEARAAGHSDTDEQVGDIILEDDVWLATGVSIMPGVRIGKGTIVAAKSVVTHDLPPGVLAGGCPAKVIKSLGINDTSNEG